MTPVTQSVIVIGVLALSRGAAAMRGVLPSLHAVASHGRGAAAPIGQIRSTPAVTTIVPASVETAHTAAGPRTAGPPLLPRAGAKFRFGFLEFEEDPDASADWFWRRLRERWQPA
jgi:hypothetical protein